MGATELVVLELTRCCSGELWRGKSELGSIQESVLSHHEPNGLPAENALP
jgi:hypothetical protein